jgi:hypothetical protein
MRRAFLEVAIGKHTIRVCLRVENSTDYLNVDSISVTSEDDSIPHCARFLVEIFTGESKWQSIENLPSASSCSLPWLFLS